MSGILRPNLWLALVVAATAATAGSVGAFEYLVIGVGSVTSWDGTGSPVPALTPQYRGSSPNQILTGTIPGGLLTTENPEFPGSLVLLRFRGENIAPGTLARGGSIRAPTVLEFTDDFRPADLQAALEELLTNEDGGELLAFERKNFDALGTLIFIDLGARFGVSRVRFYPRNTVHPSPLTPFHTDYLRAFELLANDGQQLTESGSPVWHPLREERDNREPVVDVLLDPPQTIQHLRLRAATSIDFEIDEIEVYGNGFLPNAEYVSPIFDLGMATWGNICWEERVVGAAARSQLLISTRTGEDETPFVYTRKLADRVSVEEIPLSLEDPTRPLTREEYERLPASGPNGLLWERGSVRDDREHWSPWSAPYEAPEEGSPIRSPGPRRYLQLRARFFSEDLEAARVLERISVEYLAPPLADSLVAEIYPRTVEPSRPTSFTYAVRAHIETAGVQGFDGLQIATPLQIDGVEAIRILRPDGTPTAEHIFSDGDPGSSGSFAVEEVATSGGFRVRFPWIREDAIVQVIFTTAVLVYGTRFDGHVLLGDLPGSFQRVVPGDAAILGSEDLGYESGLTVLSPSVRKHDLIADFGTFPRVFTPNGDGRNDRLDIAYNVLAVTKAADVEVCIFDLSGRAVRTLYSGPQPSGRHRFEWDGLRADGQPVLSGIYAVRVSVQGDSRSATRTRLVAVAY